MYEDGHTVCDFCDRDTGTFYKYKEPLYKGKIFEGKICVSIVGEI